MTHNLRSFLDLPKLLTGVLLLGGCSSQNPAAPSVTPDAAQTHTPAIPIGVSSVAPSVPEYAVSRPMLDKLDSITCGARAKLSLCQLVSNLGKVTGLCFELDDEALRAEGLSGDLLIAVEDDASLLTGLRSALMSHRLDLIVRGRCVVITSAVRTEATHYTATFSLAPLVNDEMTWNVAVGRFQTAAHDALWQTVDGEGGTLTLHPEDKRVDVIQTLWVMRTLEQWLSAGGAEQQ